MSIYRLAGISLIAFIIDLEIEFHEFIGDGICIYFVGAVFNLGFNSAYFLVIHNSAARRLSASESISGCSTCFSRPSEDPLGTIFLAIVFRWIFCLERSFRGSRVIIPPPPRLLVRRPGATVTAASQIS